MTNSNLGQLVAKHDGTFASGGMLWYVGGILTLSGIVSFVHPTPGLSGSDAALVGVGGLVAGAACLFVALLRFRQTFEVFEQGFVWTRLIGVVTIARSDVADAKVVTSVIRKNGRNISSTTKVVVSLRNGKTIKMNGLENPSQLASTIGGGRTRT